MTSKSAGFTLVEIIVALAVSSIIVLSLNEITNSYINTSKQGRNLNLANAYIEAKVEALRNDGYASLPLGTTSLTSSLPSQLPPSRSASMTVTTPSGGLKKVVLSVSYKDRGQTRTFSYSTYIGELGVAQ